MGMIKRPNEGLEGKQVYFGSRSEEMQSIAEAKTVILEVRGSLLSFGVHHQEADGGEWWCPYGIYFLIHVGTLPLAWHHPHLEGIVLSLLVLSGHTLKITLRDMTSTWFKIQSN